MVIAASSRNGHGSDALRDRLTRIREQIQEARDQRAELARALSTARQNFQTADIQGNVTQAPEFRRVERAKRAVDDADDELKRLGDQERDLLAQLAGQSPRPGAWGVSSDAPGAWLSRVAIAAQNPLTTDDIGSVTQDSRLFFDRLTERSAILSTPGVRVEDIDTTTVKVGRVTGRMTPAVPVPELQPIPKDDVPIADAEIEPPKWPKLVTMSFEAYRDARPVRLAATETSMVRAIAEGFDTSSFHGTVASGHVGFEHWPGVTEIALTGAMTNLDWVATGIADLLDDSAWPGVLYISPSTVRALLKLKTGVDRNEPLVGNLLDEAADLLGVPPKITRAVQPGHAFMVDPRVLLIIRRQDVETRVFEDYGFENAEVGIRAIARMQLEVAQADGVKHITGLPVAA